MPAMDSGRRRGASGLRRSLPKAQVFEDYDAMLEAGLDIVSVATPTHVSTSVAMPSATATATSTSSSIGGDTDAHQVFIPLVARMD